MNRLNQQMVDELIADAMVTLDEDALPFALGIVFANTSLHPNVGFTLANAIRAAHGDKQVAVARDSNAVKAWVGLMLIPKNDNEAVQELARRYNAAVIASGLLKRAIEAQEWANSIPRAFYLQAGTAERLQ